MGQGANNLQGVRKKNKPKKAQRVQKRNSEKQENLLQVSCLQFSFLMRNEQVTVGLAGSWR